MLFNDVFNAQKCSGMLNATFNTMLWPVLFFTLCACLCFGPGFARAAENAQTGTDIRLVIRYKNQNAGQSVTPNTLETRRTEAYAARVFAMQTQVSQSAKWHQLPMQLVRPFQDDSAVVNVNLNNTPKEVVMNRLKSDPNVLDVVEDRRVLPQATSPLDARLATIDANFRSRSWILQNRLTYPASANVAPAWANYHGSAPMVVAVVDTGVLYNHPMLAGKLLPGYDFVSEPLMGADGQGVAVGNSRDADPSDPGDGVTQSDLAAMPGCPAANTSTWHGTFVAGLLAGNPVPSEGIYSFNPHVSILPVRVLGKCGGFTTDLADGIRWAAGLPVAGAPSNPFPAKIINLSLGAQGACGNSIEGDAIAAARQAGALVVVAAGNDGSEVDSPANCTGAFTVTAIDDTGAKADYANYGAAVDIVAPGGGVNLPIWGPRNTGLYGPGSNVYGFTGGTSFTAPQVSAAAAYYASLVPQVTVANLEAALRNASRAFLTPSGRGLCNANQPQTQCVCTANTCGAGMLDFAQLLSQARSASANPQALTNLYTDDGAVLQPNTAKAFKATGSLNASGVEVTNVVFLARQVVYAVGFSTPPVVSVSGNTAQVTAPNGVLSFQLQASVPGGQTVASQVVVLDANGSAPPSRLATALSAAGLAVNPVPNESSGGVSISVSGGGALNVWGLCALAVLMVGLRFAVGFGTIQRLRCSSASRFFLVLCVSGSLAPNWLNRT